MRLRPPCVEERVVKERGQVRWSRVVVDDIGEARDAMQQQHYTGQ